MSRRNEVNYLKKIFVALFVLAALGASGPYAHQQPNRDEGSPYPPYIGTFANNEYVIQWPLPYAGDRPSHYPPYYRNSH